VSEANLAGVADAVTNKLRSLVPSKIVISDIIKSGLNIGARIMKSQKLKYELAQEYLEKAS
jgi:hypothetical protein